MENIKLSIFIKYGIIARFQAIFHKLLHPTHKVLWKTCIDLPICNGDITCETCDKLFWCRSIEHEQKIKE